MAGEWTDVCLDDLVSRRNQGVNTTTEKISYSATGVVVIRANNISPGNIDFANVTFVDAETFGRIKDVCKPKQGDVLYTNIGSQFGNAAIVKATKPFVIAWNVLRLQPNDNVNAGFLTYLLNDPSTRSRIVGLNSSSTMPFVSGKEIGNVRFFIPALDEQRAIAHILGTLDDKIELNRRINETLEAMAQTLFKSWFVDFDPVRAKAEGRDLGLPKPIADLFPDSFEDSELGEIPKGWATGAIEDLADVSSGKRPEVRYSEASAEANVPLWGGNGPMAFVPKALIEHPILLTGRVGTLGVVFRITTPCWPSDNTLIVRPKNKTAFEYLFFELRQIDFNSLNRGSTQPLLTQTDLKAQPLVLPPLELLSRFHAATGDLYRRVDESHVESRTLSALRDTLLPKLISGELRLGDPKRLVHDPAEKVGGE